MRIQSAVYTNQDHTLILVNGNMCIPVDPSNRDYRKLIAPYLEAGGLVEDFTPPVVTESLRETAIDALLQHTATLVDCPPEVKEYMDAKVEVAIPARLK